MSYIIPTLHPAHLLRGAPLSDFVVADLRKAVRVSLEGPTQHENIIWAHPANGGAGSFDALVRMALAWMERWRQTGCPVAVDIETSSAVFVDCSLFSIAVSGLDGLDTAVSFTLEDFKTLPWDAERVLVGALLEVLRSQQPKVCHNAPFDYAVLVRKGFPFNGPLWDTIALAHIIQPDAPKDLGWIGHTYLDVEPWKLNHEGRKQAYTRDPVELLVYNAKDALNTAKLVPPMYAEVRARGMDDRVVGFQYGQAKLAAHMELRGIPIRLSTRRAKAAAALEKAEKILAWMREDLKWPDFRPTPANVSKVLYGKDRLGLTVKKYTNKTQAPSTSYHDLLDYIDVPFVQKLIDYKDCMHAYSNRYKEGAGEMDAAMRPGGSPMCDDFAWLYPKWNPTGQKGSRYSSSPNVQNWPSRDLDMIEAPPGWKLVYADKDQLELRIIACLAGCTELLEVINTGQDPHRFSAENVYGDDFRNASAKDQALLRDLVKNIVYAALYNAGPKKIYATLQGKRQLSAETRARLKLNVVQFIHSRFFGRFTEITDYHQRNFSVAQNVGYIEHPPLGRRHYFPFQPPSFTEVGNRPIQCTGSDYVGLEMQNMQAEMSARFPKGEADIIMHLHDAFVTLCRDEHAAAVLELSQRHFGSSELVGPKGAVYLTATAVVRQNFLACKKAKTPWPADGNFNKA